MDNRCRIPRGVLSVGRIRSIYVRQMDASCDRCRCCKRKREREMSYQSMRHKQQSITGTKGEEKAIRTLQNSHEERLACAKFHQVM